MILAAKSIVNVAIAFRSDQGLKQKDLLPVFGSQSIASEVLNGKRSISKTQTKALGEFFKVSPTLFLDR